MEGFNYKTENFNQNNAYWLGFLANLAYENKDEIFSEVKKLNFNEFKFFTNKSTQAFICANEASLILSFRGTEKKINDWLVDLTFEQEKKLSGHVHKGFYEALEYVYSDILSYIQTNLNGKSLWITGHSLGAALAGLASIKFTMDENIKINGIYTFGEPKIGDKKFALNYDNLLGEILFRYVNNNDIVPRVPFSLPAGILSYVQIGQMKYFDSDGILNEDITRAKLAWDRFKGRVDDLGKLGTDGIKDHSMNRYLKLLDNARKLDSKSEIEQILTQAMSQLQNIAKDGYKSEKINIPILDPYKLSTNIEKEFKFSRGDFKLTLNNPIITGISTINIAKLPSVNLAKRELSFGISFDKLILQSDDYNLNGTYKIIFKNRNLSREGKFELEAKNIEANFNLKLDFKDNLPIVTANKTECIIGNIDLDMEDIYVLDLIIPFFKESYEKIISQHLQKLITQFLTHKLQNLYLSQKDMLMKIKKLYDMKKVQSDEKSGGKSRIFQGFDGVGELPLPLFWELPSVDIKNSKHISINEVVENAQTGDVILFAGSYPSSKRIRRLTQSCFSHVVIVIKEPEIADGKACIWQATSSIHRGVLRNMEKKSGIQLNYLEEMVQDYRDEDAGAIICFRKLNRNPRDEKLEKESINNLIEFIKEMDGKPYTDDMDGLYIMGLMEVDNPNQEDYFCAGIVAESQIKFNILKDTFKQYQYAPRDFSQRQNNLPFINSTTHFGEQIVID